MDRETLRVECWKLYRQYYPPTKGLEVICPQCNKPIRRDLAVHEWLVKRGTEKPALQDLLMVPENCVPIHNSTCHIPDGIGQTRETKEKCLWYAAGVLTARRIGEWYVSLWKYHGLSVPKGLLVAPSDLPPYNAKHLYEQGCKTRGISAAEEDNAMAVTAFLYWSGRIKRTEDVRKLDQLSLLTPTIELLSEGLWINYLLGVIG